MNEPDMLGTVLDPNMVGTVDLPSPEPSEEPAPLAPVVEALAPVPIAPPARGEEPSVGMMLQSAIEHGVSVEALEKLVALHERMTDRRAAQEFAEAMSHFQDECPSIEKKSEARITTKSGTQYRVRYAELDTIAQTIRPILRKCGLSYSWDSTVDGKELHCTCTLRHVNGHSVTASFSCPTDASGAMNEQQKTAAALTYARRQSLVQVLGLTTTDPDTDGVSSETVSQSQAADLQAKAREVGANERKFLAYLGIEASADIVLEDYLKIRADDYDRALKALEQRGRR